MVVAPDGTCVIGEEASCLVQGTPLGKKDTSVILSGQNYTVDYSTLGTTQRFTITSAEPILGMWKIQVEKDGIVQEDMMSTVIVKVRYMAQTLP